MLAAEESALEAQEEMEAVQGVADEANEALAQVLTPTLTLTRT